MKVYLMTDLEGVAGVMNSTDWIYRDSKYYEKAKELLTLEVNAAVCGFFSAGADEIVVHDGHGPGAVDIMLLDPRARLQRGWYGPNGGAYPFGMDESYDVYACVGQHPKSATPFGHLCHTGTFHTLDFTINGISVGEYGQQILLCHNYGITPIFASGCLAFTKEAQALVSGIETAAVKEGIRPGSGDECNAEEYEMRNWGAIHLAPAKARELIREHAEAALLRYLTDPDSFRPVHVNAPYSKVIRTREHKGIPGKTITWDNYSDLAELLNA